MNKNDFRAANGKAINDWMERLENEKGDRAALRRAQADSEVYSVEMAHRLVATLKWRNNDVGTVLFLAALLAHVREPRAGLLIDGLLEGATDGKPGSAKLKPLRFAQLLRADELPDRLRMFRRALQLVEGKADAIDLAYLFLTWSENATKRDFARRYFAPRAPVDSAEEIQVADSPN